MPLFRKKADSSLQRTSSLSVYGQARVQGFLNSKNVNRTPDSGSYSSLDLDDRPQPFLAFAEATYDPDVPIKTKSRLSKDLNEVLHDNAALAYFIQFLDSLKAKHLVKFWLEAESFKVSSETRCKSQSYRQKLSHSKETSLNSAYLPSSGSSGCISDKSDEVFQISSQAQSSIKGGNVNSTYNKDLSSDTDFIKCNSSINKTHLNPSLSNDCDNLLKTVLEEVHRDECNKTINDKCEHLFVNEPNKIFKHSIEKNLSENVNKSVNDISTNLFNANDFNSCKKWTEESLNLCQKQENEQNKDGFIKHETSSEEDANKIFSQYIASNAPFPIHIPEEIQQSLSDIIFKCSSTIDPYCFVPAQEFVVQKMDKEYFPLFLRSSFHCKHQIDVLTSGNVFLADVLYNDSALFYFMEFMEQEGVRHLVDFLLTADNFNKQLLAHKGQYDGMQAQADAMVLYDKYFSLQATSPLGFSDRVRYEIEANICREEGPLPDCFLKPVKILTQYLEKTYLLQFLNSQLYFKYISECIISIQNEGSDVSTQSKYTASDSSSEQSLPISSINTLLAMDSKQPGSSKILKNLDDQDMRIDTLQFKPDALWKRPLAGKLQMAHVDHLGRVTTDFEPEPDKRKESRISKAVKKLVNWEEDKNQEDMAWKVAEMIVKDICSVTMPESSNSVHENTPS